MNVRNRVIEVRSVRFADVKTHPRNPRRHSRKQGRVLQALVSEVGFASIPLAYHSETNHGALTWVDGHLRSQTFPDYQGQVAILDITDEEASVLLSTLDPLASMATTATPSFLPAHCPKPHASAPAPHASCSASSPSPSPSRPIRYLMS